MILQNVEARVVPVIRNFTIVMPSQHVMGIIRALIERRWSCNEEVPEEHRLLSPSGLQQEPVHLPVVHVGPGVVPIMRPPAIDRVGIVIGGDTWPLGIWEAHVVGESFSPRVRTEVMIEATVLLHDEHEMLEPLQAERRARCFGRMWFMAHAPEFVLCPQALGTHENHEDDERDSNELEPTPRRGLQRLSPSSRPIGMRTPSAPQARITRRDRLLQNR